jgi:acetyl esterase/lipase
MNRSKAILVVCILCSNLIFSQISYPVDTSYTVNSAYNKSVKKFPKIEIVKPDFFENVIEIKDLVYKNIEGRKLHLDAFYNKNEQLKPAVILIHGGGWRSGNKSHMVPMAQHIATKGYACFAVEYRLSPEAIFPAAIFDIKNAIQFIKANSKEFKIDPDKVAILGCSSGGQMAALIGTTNNNKNFEDLDNRYSQSSSVQAIVDIDGVLAFKHPESSEGEMASLWLDGNSCDKLETWMEASAVTHTDKNTPPILFIGSQYPRFLAGKNDMMKILDEYGIYNQVETIENSPHTFWLFHPWFEETVQHVTNFLDKTLK